MNIYVITFLHIIKVSYFLVTLNIKKEILADVLVRKENLYQGNEYFLLFK